MRDTLNKLYRNGLISYKPIFYLEVKDKVRQLKASGLKHTEAINMVARDMRVSRQTIYKAIRLTNDI